MTYDEIGIRFLAGHDDAMTEVCGLFAAQRDVRWRGYDVAWRTGDGQVTSSIRPSHPRLVAAALDALREDPVRCALRAYRNHAVATRERAA